MGRKGVIFLKVLVIGGRRRYASSREPGIKPVERRAGPGGLAQSRLGLRKVGSTADSASLEACATGRNRAYLTAYAHENEGLRRTQRCPFSFPARGVRYPLRAFLQQNKAFKPFSSSEIVGFATGCHLRSRNSRTVAVL